MFFFLFFFGICRSMKYFNGNSLFWKATRQNKGKKYGICQRDCSIRYIFHLSFWLGLAQNKIIFSINSFGGNRFFTSCWTFWSTFSPIEWNRLNISLFFWLAKYGTYLAIFIEYYLLSKMSLNYAHCFSTLKNVVWNFNKGILICWRNTRLNRKTTQTIFFLNTSKRHLIKHLNVGGKHLNKLTLINQFYEMFILITTANIYNKLHSSVDGGIMTHAIQNV